uniref:DNA glycosylase AlkZ-like family protein n=1 Tax=Streptomyces sp. CA-136453 TaxID=3240050 RepID=UPI003F493687
MAEAAGQRGPLCFGASRGRKAICSGPARWVPGFALVPEGAALVWLLGRYLSAYGPATPCSPGG